MDDADSATPVIAIGGRSLIAPFLLRRLQAAGRSGFCLRRAAAAGPAPPLPPGFALRPYDPAAAGPLAPAGSVVLSLAPLWVLPPLLPRLAGAARLVALGSTSAAVKADSPHAADRRIAQALDDAEAAIRAGAGEAGPAWTILRPTLVYDCRTDGTVTAAAHVIDRFGVFPIPGGAGGRRQPVHADDVAAAMLAALAAPAAYNRAFDLPGGETLAWRTMLARIAEALGRPVRLLPVPLPLLTAGLWAARRAGRDLSPSLFARMTVDQLFDAGPARSAFGYDPGPFRPVFPWARRTARNPPSHARP